MTLFVRPKRDCSAAACLLLGIVVSIIIVADVLNDRGARRFDRLVATRLAQRRRPVRLRERRRRLEAVALRCLE